MFKKILITLCLSFIAINNIAYSADGGLNYTKLTVVDLNTFNEYRFRITEQFLNLRDKYEINGTIDSTITNNIIDLAEQGYNYLPDNLTNKNYLSKIKTALNKGLKYPDSDSSFSEISNEILSYLQDVDIDKVKGSVEAFPETGNAPLTVTFRGSVIDPTGTTIPSYNYIWWMDDGGKRKILSNSKGPSLNYTFKEEGAFSVFLDVTSNHKNVKGFTDVLPFRSRANIVVKEKIASLIIKVNSETLRSRDELKFTPDEAKYGLLFDATSSTPTHGSKFTRTTWDFGNGVTREYSGDPKVERVIYSKEGEYRVKLKLRTNEGKTVEREFDIVVHDPIATIKTNIDEGFLGDTFTFSAQSGLNDDDLTFAWEIIDIKEDKIIFRKTGKLFTYSFSEKGQYNLVLKVTEPSSNVPDIDTKIIYINSKAPVVSFTSEKPFPNKPNTVLLDGTKSFDPDFSDEGKLKFSWIIDGERVKLENPNYNGSIGYYTFDSIGDHSVVLEVLDPDDITIQTKDKVTIDSILSVDFAILPRVAQREQNIRFFADSSEARVYEWDFGDGNKEGGNNPKAEHKYLKSGIFSVKLKVIDKDDNSNYFTRDVYIGESEKPLAFINVTSGNNSSVSYKKGVCNGNGAYMVNRVDTIKFSGEESINITGENSGLTYSWKLNNDKYYSSRNFDKKFDELGCFPVKLTVKSDDNGKTSTKYIWVKVENELPTLSSLNVVVQDETSDPVIVNVNALGAKDLDGVIQSYLWYYYTDIDPEPQDFRATREPSTNFVLPKVTGNYYFVAVMKDNNEARTNSEQITGSKYFITLSGDNINTPLVDLKVSNSSVSIGEEVILTAKVKNILDQDITKKVEFSWDLDGDGFYEKETNKSEIIYSYENSGEFHPKVKAKYKGYSNTKSITMAVANILKPDFSYISIGNEFIFLDKSIGTINDTRWELGDETIINDKNSFIHTYSDKKPSHMVKLTLKEGTKTKTLEKKVIKNMKNFLKSKKSGLIVFSDPEIIENKIILEKKRKTYIYLKDNSSDIKNYVIDYNINYDSDLNGGKDDDEDNKNDGSYSNGNPILIDLNDSKIQHVRVMTKDSLGNVVNSYDFVIEKEYIEEIDIDTSLINFDGVSSSEKLKIEQLKDYINDLSKEYKLKALMYIQKLQEEWFDDREKTNVILEFEAFINETGDNNTENIINLLESLLVEGQEDKSEKSIILNALKNLIPLGIKCGDEDFSEEVESNIDVAEVSCYDSLVEKLEIIKDNINLEENKILGKEILMVIEGDNIMENKQKLDFKEILKTLVYGGLENIPEDQIEEPEVEDEGEGKSILGLIGTIIFWLAVIIGCFIGILVLYYIFYKLSNKDKNVGFQDYIIDKTSSKKSTVEKDVEKEEKDSFDILGELNEKKEKNKVEKTEVKQVEEKVKKEDIIEKKEEVVEENTSKPAQEVVPDWLKGSFSADDKKPVEKEKEVDQIKEEKVKQEENIIETKEEKNSKASEESVPDWLKGSFTPEDKTEDKVDDKKVEDKKSKKKEETKDTKVKKESVEEKLPSNEELEEITKIDDVEEDDKIPDWLKGSFTPEDNKQNNKKESKNKKENNKEEKETKKEEEVKQIAAKKTEEIKEVKVEKEENKKTEDKKTKTSKQKAPKTKKEETKKEEPKKEESKKIEKKSENKKVDNKKIEDKVEEKNIDNKKVEEKKEEKDKNIEDKKETSDLWDDGMKIPDWLKTDDDK